MCHVPCINLATYINHRSLKVDEEDSFCHMACYNSPTCTNPRLLKTNGEDFSFYFKILFIQNLVKFPNGVK
jgi:hypothetical protein